MGTFFQNLMKMRSAVLLLVVLLGVSAVHSQEFDKSLLRRLYNELAKRDDTSSDQDVRAPFGFFVCQIWQYCVNLGYKT